MTPDDLSDPGIQPVVVFTSPANYSTGPYSGLFSPGDNNPHFVIRFNKLMRKSSVKPGSVRILGYEQPVVVTLYQPGAYKRPRVGVPNSSQGDYYYSEILEFSVKDSAYRFVIGYELGRTYTVILDTSLEDINGNQLRGYSFSFTPEPYFRIATSTPINNAIEVNPFYLTPAIIFNSDVGRNILGLLSISPPVSGSWYRDLGGSRVFFSIDASQLQYNTQYTLSVNPAATDVMGNQIHGTTSVVFTTRAFRILSANPAYGAKSVALYSSINLSLSGPAGLNASSAVSISPAVPINTTFPSVGLGYSVEIDPASNFAPETDYKISFSSSLTATDGTPLEPYEYRFRTDSFHVYYTIPNDGATNVTLGTYSPIRISFNALVDTTGLRDAFSIDPPMNGTFNLLQGSPSYSFTPNYGEVRSYTRYTVTIAPGSMTTTGVSMRSPYTFSFKTGFIY